MQSRFYRAPEILLGLPYTQSADMWSFGCIMAELTTRLPLFPAQDENELLELFVMMVGMPNSSMIQKAKKKNKFFDKNGNLVRSKQTRIERIEPKAFPVKVAIFCEDDEDYMDFVEVS